MVKDPEAGDFVRISGRIISIDEGVALVEVYRSYPVGLRIPVQCGALEHVEPSADDDSAPAPTGLDRVSAAVRKARGGDPPVQVRGFA